MNNKTCSKCGETKEPSDFYRNGHYALSAWCKQCLKRRSAEQVQAGYGKELRAGRRQASDSMRRLNLTPLQRASYTLWNNTKKRQVRAGGGDTFNLTLEYVEQLVTDFCNANYHEFSDGSATPFQPSLDRIDPIKGYAIGNVRVIWLIENYARNRFTDEQVIEFCKRKLGIL